MSGTDQILKPESALAIRTERRNSEIYDRIDFHDHRYGGRVGIPANPVYMPVRACEEKVSAQTNSHTVSGGLDSTLQIVAETNFNI